MCLRATRCALAGGKKRRSTACSPWLQNPKLWVCWPYPAWGAHTRTQSSSPSPNTTTTTKRARRFGSTTTCFLSHSCFIHTPPTSLYCHFSLFFFLCVNVDTHILQNRHFPHDAEVTQDGQTRQCGRPPLPRLTRFSRDTSPQPMSPTNPARTRTTPLTSFSTAQFYLFVRMLLSNTSGFD